jgi:YggT family protein
MIALLFTTLITFINLYMVLLFARIILTWFPTINWFDPPFSILGQLTDPYLNIFRNIIPPLGGLDISPMLAILLLQVLLSVLPSVAHFFMNIQGSFAV